MGQIGNKYRSGWSVKHKIVAWFFEHLGSNKGVHIMEQDWDNLIILDACRLDVYKTKRTHVDFVRSLGSCTQEWADKNFAEKSFPDTVYVTANPVINRYAGNCFHKIYSVWETEWDKNNHTVLPESVNRAALGAIKRHPDKRLIVHYVQPHHPFLANFEADDRGNSPYIRVRKGEISIEAVWDGYRSNFEVVWPYADSLAGSLPGKSVITSDHGEALGERIWPFPVCFYAHAWGVHIPALVNVPWDVRDGARRRIVAGSVEDASVGDETIGEHLNVLGYI